jgi:hypothetical protein
MKKMSEFWKFVVIFMETSHKPLHLGSWRFAQWNITDITTSFIRFIILFGETFKYDSNALSWGYVGTNAETIL